MTELAINHQARAHSNIVGGSTAKRVINCTASVLHNQKYPNTESSFAAEGTACHEATDFILQGQVDKDEQVIGLVFNKIMIDQKLFDKKISVAIRYFDAIQYGDEEWDAENYGEIGEVLGPIDFFNEQRVKIPGIPIPITDEDGHVVGVDEDATFGTCDVIGYAPDVDRTIVLDWKFGDGVPVDAEFNEQMMYYALGAMHTAPTNQFFKKGRKIELIIAQPSSIEGAPFSRWITTVEQIEAFGTDLRRAVATALTDEAEFKPGTWCKFCPGESGCPAKRGIAVKGLEMGIDEIAKDLDPWLDKADDIIALGKAIKARGQQAAELGAKFTNFKLVRGLKDREWVDETVTLKAVMKAGLTRAEAFTTPQLKSPAQIEAALKDKNGGKKTELPLDPKKQLLTKRDYSGTTLAKRSDKREEVLITTQALSKLAGRLASAGGLTKKPAK